MNDLMVIQTAQGVAKYVLAQHGPNPPQAVGDKRPADGNKWQAVIGYDHRAANEWGLSSERFARLTAAVFAKAGIEPLLLAGLVPTPLVAFATKAEANVVAGIMVNLTSMREVLSGRVR